MSEWVEGPDVSDMAVGELREFDLDGHELVAARTDEGFLVADNRCPHLGGRLSKGKLTGSIVTCHLHKSQFDLRDGSVVAWTDFQGAVKTIAELARHPRPLRVYASNVREDGVLLIGEQHEPPQ